MWDSHRGKEKIDQICTCESKIVSFFSIFVYRCLVYDVNQQYNWGAWYGFL